MYADKFLDTVLYTTAPDLMGFFTVVLKPNTAPSVSIF